MRLSCNFVNVYTIVCHVQYTYMHVYTRASPTDILARKSVRRTKVRGQVGELQAGRLPREEVRVGVGVGPVEFQLNAAPSWLAVVNDHQNVKRFSLNSTEAVSS